MDKTQLNMSETDQETMSDLTFPGSSRKRCMKQKDEDVDLEYNANKRQASGVNGEDVNYDIETINLQLDEQEEEVFQIADDTPGLEDMESLFGIVERDVNYNAGLDCLDQTDDSDDNVFKEPTATSNLVKGGIGSFEGSFKLEQVQDKDDKAQSSACFDQFQRPFFWASQLGINQKPMTGQAKYGETNIDAEVPEIGSALEKRAKKALPHEELNEAMRSLQAPTRDRVSRAREPRVDAAEQTEIMWNYEYALAMDENEGVTSSSILYDLSPKFGEASDDLLPNVFF